MNYIMLDFEWNQSPYGRESSVKRLPFEIIEIGAVKLDEQAAVIDEYDVVIRPEVYKKLHRMTMEMTGFTEDELKQGFEFDRAALDFLLWCGEDYIFCTWGNLDLLEFQRNLRYYKILDLLEGPVKYINLQKIFKKFYSDAHAVCALETAVEYFGIKKDRPFHRAIQDAKYTAEIFAHMDRKKMLDNFTLDYYQYPMQKKEEIELYYEDYYKYISRGFKTKEAVMRDKRVCAARCFMCGKEAELKVGWFVSKTRSYYCLVWCPEHGYTRGKIKPKRMDDGKIVAVKTLRPVNEAEAEKILELKKEIVEKRRERRHHGEKGNSGV